MSFIIPTRVASGSRVARNEDADPDAAEGNRCNLRKDPRSAVLLLAPERKVVASGTLSFGRQPVSDASFAGSVGGRLRLAASNFAGSAFRTGCIGYEVSNAISRKRSAGI